MDAFAAQAVELLDADLVLDVELAGDLELLFDLELHRQAMRVPARLALDVEALHRFVAPEEVLEGAGEYVVGGRLAVGRGRALVEDKPRSALTQLERSLEGALFFPAPHELDLELREADSRINLLEHSLSTKTRTDCVWDESSIRPAVPPRFPRPSKSLRLGRSLGNGSGVISFRHRPPGLTFPGSLSTAQTDLPVSVNAE